MGSRSVDKIHHLVTLILEGVGEEIPRAAVKIGRGDDIVADAREVLDGEGRGRLAGR